MIALIIFFVWLVLSQVIAWLIADGDEDMVLDLWVAVFLLVPMGILYGVVWLLHMALHKMFPFWTRKPTVDDVIL